MSRASDSDTRLRELRGPLQWRHWGVLVERNALLNSEHVGNRYDSEIDMIYGSFLPFLCCYKFCILSTQKTSNTPCSGSYSQWCGSGEFLTASASASASACSASASASNFLKLVASASASASSTFKLTRFRFHFRFHCFEINSLPLPI